MIFEIMHIFSDSLLIFKKHNGSTLVKIVGNIGFHNLFSSHGTYHYFRCIKFKGLYLDQILKKTKVCCGLVTELCATLCDSMDYSLPGSSVHGSFQARIL